MLIPEHSFGQHRVFPLDVPFGKIYQMLHSFFLKKILKSFWRKSEGNPKLAARNEYASVDITANSTKDILNSTEC